jgi:quinol monooxygenase YgiN
LSSGCEQSERARVMQGFGLVVRFNLRPGHEAQFDALVSETLNGIRNQEPGTLVYATHTLTGAPGTRVFYELYRDREAFDAHESQPHTRRFLAARDEHVETFSVDFLSLVDGKGVDAAQT